MKGFRGLIVGVALGAVVSMMAGFVQSDRTVYQGHHVYYGVPLAVMLVVGVLLWLNRVFGSRMAGIGVLVAWLFVTWQLARTTSGGDLVIAPSTNAHVYLIAGSLCLGIASSLPAMRQLSNQPAVVVPSIFSGTHSE